MNTAVPLMARRTPELLQYLGKQDHQKLFQVLTRLPRFGMGRKFTRAIWRMEDSTIKAHPCYWTITRVVPNKVLSGLVSSGVSEHFLSWPQEGPGNLFGNLTALNCSS